MRVGKIYSLSGLLLIFILLLLSCSSRGIGYGIILWPPEDSSLESADTVRIISESNIQESYIIVDPRTEENLSIKRWRVGFHNNDKDARTAAADYASFANTMPLSNRVGLPVRSQPDASSDRVYRLRKHEEMKVLSKATREVQVGEYQGFWYEVLTQDGTRGYCFDRELTFYQEGERDSVLAVQNTDPRLDDFFTRSYHPERFVHLIRRRTPALEALNPEFGLFPDDEQGVIRIISSKYRLSIEYSEIKEAGRNRFHFADSDLYITLETPEPPVSSILAHFKFESEELTARFIAVPDLEDVIEKEKIRREEALQQIVEMGERFMSSAYGTIEIFPDGSFNWTGKERLVPGTIKANFGDAGTIRFDRYISPQLRRDYDGAGTFRFYGADPQQGISFLYKLEPQGIRFTMIPEDNVNDFMIEDTGYNSLVLFMNLQN